MAPLLGPQPTFSEGWLVDATLGGGGHTQLLLSALERAGLAGKVRVLARDQDESAIRAAQERFGEEIASGFLELSHGPFGSLDEVLRGRPVLGLLADLGFSSDQIDSAERGLSFRLDGPLDMRLDPSRGESCLQFLGHVREKELADIIFELGEERHSRKIAAAIVSARSRRELPQTTVALADLIWRATPPAQRQGRIHPATRTFQALRIYVNDELGELDRLLERVIIEVVPGGRVAILSFHSLEDRKVKQVFKGEGWTALSKKPVEADEAEVAANPRARSAKLRIAERKS